MAYNARRRREQGATMLEYALMLTLIAAVILPVLWLFGPAVAGLFTGAIAAF
jgi:Flp pilus assembly pilin Flp